MTLTWRRLDNRMYLTVARTRADLVRLSVESLPEDGWDWLIWHTVGQNCHARGTAVTAPAAMAAAEQALAEFGATPEHENAAVY